MIDRLPEGKSIGWMQAPPQWIFTHTVRFIGIVRVVIQDGEGFILIQKGKPLAYYFKHGRIELRGHAAIDYFNSHPTIEFNLCKYTADEFSEALRICNIEDQSALPDERADRNAGEPAPAPRPASPPEQSRPPVQPPSAPADLTFEPRQPAEPRPPVPQATPGPAAVPPPPPPPPPAPPEPPVPSPAAPKEPVSAVPPPAAAAPRPIPPPPPQIPSYTAAPAAPSPLPVSPPELDEQDIRIIGQIKKLNGVVAISVFSEDRNIILMGDVEIEPLLKIARSMLATTRKITPLLEWGSFVHITLQIPEGNVIIAPYGDYHLCLLTTRTINIGHIRRILRDLQTGG